MSKAVTSALLLVLASAVLGATVFREPFANAARLSQGVLLTNTAEQAVPVREQNLDGGSIRVHEQGRVAVRPTVPATPWHRFRIVNAGSHAALTEEPSASAINVTSLTVAENGVGGATPGAAAFLDAVAVPDTAVDCVTDAVGTILWASTMVTGPLAVPFPTPLVASAPPGQKICLRASVTGESWDSVWFSISGFFGSD
jgi:hypothetical protein